MSGGAPWDFGYRPIPAATGGEDGPCDVVVATHRAVSTAALREALSARLPDATITQLFARPPIFWARVSAPRPARAAEIAAALAAARIPVRYVASARHGSVALAPKLDMRTAPPARAEGWRRRPASRATEPDSEGRWFLREREGGVAVIDGARGRVGSGAGTRLAVIDDDALGVEHLELDRELLVGLDAAPRHQVHGALMVAWAVGSRGFRGVAPDASPRLYLIPKPEQGVLWLPLAIARAVSDGADVIVCATYIEGLTSPMLDDALEFAARAGRRGLGAAVLVPTGREANSPAGSLHASFSLDLGSVAADPRVYCVAPGARGRGWFFFRDRRGLARPFANRGPSVRFLAPGDDIAYPFASPERLFHAESSGASAIAAGVLLLVLAVNPSLRLEELEDVLTRTLTPVSPEPPPRAAPLSDPSDALPLGRDRDGHNAKHGYGLLHAGRACLSAADPISSALVSIGEDAAARAWMDARKTRRPLGRLYSARLGRWMARALIVDATAAHALKVVVRHMRLCAGRPERFYGHTEGAVLRQIALIVRRWASRPRPRPSRRTMEDLDRLTALLWGIVARPTWRARAERWLAEIGSVLFAKTDG